MILKVLIPQSHSVIDLDSIVHALDSGFRETSVSIVEGVACLDEREHCC